MIQDIHLKMTESTTCTLKHSILLGRFRDYSPLRHIAVLVHDGLAYTTCLLHRFQPSNNGRYMIVHRQSNRVLTSSSITSPGTLNLADRNNSLSQQGDWRLLYNSQQCNRTILGWRWKCKYCNSKRYHYGWNFSYVVYTCGHAPVHLCRLRRVNVIAYIAP